MNIAKPHANVFSCCVCAQGEQFGVLTNWTSCKNWTGYTCATGGWGISDPDDIVYLVEACPVSCSDGPCSTDFDDYLPTSYSSYDDTWDSRDPVGSSTVCTCPIEWRGDGECDRLCNTAPCGWDENDCFHGDTGCYEHPTGADYRGNVSVTLGGKTCQPWESQWPNTHTYTTANYPDANLGGHNSCRNPSPEDGSTGPWCIVDVYSWEQDEVWGYCDIGKPSRKGSCPSPHKLVEHNHSSLALNKWTRSSVLEHRYDYYAVPLPAGLRGFKAVVVPEEDGDPNLFLSFDTPFPTGHNYTYKQDSKGGVEIFHMTSGTYGYCGVGARAWQVSKGCMLYLSVTAFESSAYNLVVMDIAHPNGTACAAGCDWKQLGDGVCNPQCNVSVRRLRRCCCLLSAGLPHTHTHTHTHIHARARAPLLPLLPPPSPPLPPLPPSPPSPPPPPSPHRPIAGPRSRASPTAATARIPPTRAASAARPAARRTSGEMMAGATLPASTQSAAGTATIAAWRGSG